MHFVWLEALTMLLNNPINIFLINQNIILYHVLFIKYLWISKISLSIGLKSTEKNFTTPFNPVFFILLIVKSFETSPKHSEQSFISEFFALNWYKKLYNRLANKKLLLPLQYKLNINLFPD